MWATQVAACKNMGQQSLLTKTKVVERDISLAFGAGYQKRLHLAHELPHVVSDKVLLQRLGRSPLFHKVENVVVEGRRVELEVRHSLHSLLRNCHFLMPFHGSDKVVAVLRLGL